MEVLEIIGLALMMFAPIVWRVWKGRNDPGPEPPDDPPLYTIAAAACGLTVRAAGGRRGRRTLHAASGNLSVRLEQRERGAEEDTRQFETVIAITRAGDRMPISLRRERRGFLERDRSAREIEIGDKEFDDDFHVTGPHTFVRALLDAPTRRLLRTLLLEVDLDVDRGDLSGALPVTTGWAMHERTLAHMLGLMIDAARRLERPPDVARRLADNARLDPLPEVRLQNLLTLMREYPERPATDEALGAACGDTSDWIRVRAATALGERGRTTLFEVALRDPPDDAATAQAIAVLGDRLTPDRVRGILGRALRARQPGTARACLAALGSRGGTEAVEEIARVMSVEKGDLAVAAADALGATDSPTAEPRLLAALHGDRDLRIAAARALGRVGSAAAVGALKEAEAQAREADFSRVARQAIAEIQARLPGASPGQLSLATGAAGTLSLAEDERGRLSLKDAPPR